MLKNKNDNLYNMGPSSVAPDEIQSTDPVKGFYSWKEYNDKICFLKNLIDVKPDYIVSIGKGGSIPGVILAEHFNVDNYNLGIKSYCDFNQSEIIEYQPLQSYDIFKGKNILLVDDLADSGKTFDYALSKFKENGVENIKTVSVFKKKHSKFVPDFFVEELGNNIWVVHPWEK